MLAEKGLIMDDVKVSELGCVIRKIRKFAKITQTEFCKSFNMHRSTFIKFELHGQIKKNNLIALQYNLNKTKIKELKRMLVQNKISDKISEILKQY